MEKGYATQLFDKNGYPEEIDLVCRSYITEEIALENMMEYYINSGQNDMVSFILYEVTEPEDDELEGCLLTPLYKKNLVEV